MRSEEYAVKINRLRQIENSPIVVTVVGCFLDFLSSYFVRLDEVIDTSSGDKDILELNDKLLELNVVDSVISGLRDLIFWGEITTKLDNGAAEPVNIRTIACGLQLEGYCTVENKEKVEIVAEPLFLQIESSILEYTILRKLISINSIRQLTKPELLVAEVSDPDRLSYSVESIKSELQQIENVLNATAEYSVMGLDKLTESDLLRLSLNKSKVYADKNGVLKSVKHMEGGLENKTNYELKSLTDLRNEILSALGVPYDLFDNRWNRFESIRQSSRMMSRVLLYSRAIVTHLYTVIDEVIKLLGLPESMHERVILACFDDFDAKLAAKEKSVQQVKEFVKSLSDIVGSERVDELKNRLVEKLLFDLVN